MIQSPASLRQDAWQQSAIDRCPQGQNGLDGFVISDWDGIAEVASCANDSCPQAINAGVDMIMVPDNWKKFIKNTIAQVESGQIPGPVLMMR